MEERTEAESILERHAGLHALHPNCCTLAWTHAWCSLESAMFWGTPEEALRLAERQRQALFQSGYSVLTDTGRLLRGRVRVRAAAALRQASSRTSLLRGAASDVKVKRGGALVQGMAALVEAGVAMQRDRPEQALSLLDSAIAELVSAEAAMMVASARYIKGAMLGGDAGHAMKCLARATLEEEGILAPERWIAWTVPGFDVVAGLER
jgi:hypothetical protein